MFEIALHVFEFARYLFLNLNLTFLTSVFPYLNLVFIFWIIWFQLFEFELRLFEFSPKKVWILIDFAKNDTDEHQMNSVMGKQIAALKIKNSFFQWPIVHILIRGARTSVGERDQTERSRKRSGPLAIPAPLASECRSYDLGTRLEWLQALTFGGRRSAAVSVKPE